MDSLVEKEVLEDASAYVNELEENSEFKVTSTRKKLVERHHNWKKEAYKKMPGNVKSIRLDEDGEEIRPKYLSNHTHYSLTRSEEHTSELQSRGHLVCRLLLEKKNKNTTHLNS